MHVATALTDRLYLRRHVACRDIYIYIYIYILGKAEAVCEITVGIRHTGGKFFDSLEVDMNLNGRVYIIYIYIHAYLFSTFALKYIMR
jgi:hypothetical protein